MYTVLYPTVLLTAGGAERQLVELVRGLDKQRFRPIVAPLYRGGAFEDKLRAVPGVEVIGLDRHHKLDFSVVSKLVRLLRDRNVDIVQPFVSPASFFGLLAGILARTPVKIATERGGARRAPGLGGRLYLYAASRLLRFADVTVANSEAGRGMLRREGLADDRICVITNGINPSRLQVAPDRVAAIRRRLGGDDIGPIIGILATLKPAKGHDTFLRAAGYVAARHPRAQFAIVGDGPLRDDLESLSEELGIRRRVHFFGYQPHVADFLSLFDVLVSASRDNEGHSNSILETMALGVPVIATDIGGSRELVAEGRSGLLVPIDDHRQLAAAIGGLLDDRDAAASLVAHARELIAERFTLDRMVASYVALYEQMLDRSSGQTAPALAWQR